MEESDRSIGFKVLKNMRILATTLAASDIAGKARRVEEQRAESHVVVGPDTTYIVPSPSILVGRAFWFSFVIYVLMVLDVKIIISPTGWLINGSLSIQVVLDNFPVVGAKRPNWIALP